MNKVFLTGRVSFKSEVRYGANAKPFLTFGLITNQRFHGESGPGEIPTRHTIMVRKPALIEVLEKHLDVGQWLEVEGSLNYYNRKVGSEEVEVAQVVLQEFNFGSKARSRSKDEQEQTPS